MKEITIRESDLDLYCEIKLLNEYTKFLNTNNLVNYHRPNRGRGFVGSI